MKLDDLVDDAGHLTEFGAQMLNAGALPDGGAMFLVDETSGEATDISCFEVGAR